MTTKEYQREYYLKNRERYLAMNRRAKKKRSVELREEMSKRKTDSGCSRCGYNRCARALHWHHTDPESKELLTTIRSRMSVSEERFEEEISKCILLCANCHAEAHS